MFFLFSIPVWLLASSLLAVFVPRLFILYIKGLIWLFAYPFIIYVAVRQRFFGKVAKVEVVE